jgi:hypothetical protein
LQQLLGRIAEAGSKQVRRIAIVQPLAVGLAIGS